MPEAQANLAAMFLKGDGVDRDLVEALKWYLLAAPSVPEANSQAQLLATELDDSEVAEARRRAASFSRSK